jgi:hypothetical protein
MACIKQIRTNLTDFACNVLYCDGLRAVTKCGEKAQSPFTPLSNVWLSVSQFSQKIAPFQ